MPGFLLDETATVTCVHGGQAEPAVPNPAVTLDGMPTLLLTTPWIVAGCPGVPSEVPPCVTGQGIAGTTRVTSFGQPLLIQTGTADSTPAGTPLLPVVTQTRVAAT